MPGLETGRHQLPLLAVSQAQKEVTHNEAIVLIDALLHMGVEGVLSAEPAPTENDIGKSWLVGRGATGRWENKSGQIAVWIGGGWRFVAPHEGMSVWNKASAGQSIYVRHQWLNAPAIANPVGGALVDLEARAALGAILQYFRLIGLMAT